MVLKTLFSINTTTGILLQICKVFIQVFSDNCVLALTDKIMLFMKLTNPSISTFVNKMRLKCGVKNLRN